MGNLTNNSIDQAESNTPTHQLTAVGGPFEMVDINIDGIPCRIFKNTPNCLCELYPGLNEFSERTMVVYEDRRVSYAEVLSQAAALAAFLRDDHDIGHCSRVAMAIGNSPEWFVAFIAITSLGGTAVLINSRGTAEEVQHAIISTDCELLITETRCLTKLNGATESSLTIPSVVTDAPTNVAGSAVNDKVTAYVDIVTKHTGAELPFTRCEPTDPALILFTSGTSGQAKGAILSHRSVLTALMTNRYSAALVSVQMAARYGIDLDTLNANRPIPSTLLVFPLFHVSGCHSVFLTNLVQGGKIVLMRRWEPEQALQLIESEKVAAFPGVPTMFWDLLQVEAFNDYNLESLTSLSVGGQSTPLSLINAVREAFPAAILGTGYGMTETTGAITLTVGDDFINNPTSTGSAVATTEIRIADESGAWLPAGERGEICVRGATIMDGYANLQKPADYSRDGWLLTGDIGQLDEQGRLYIVDRRTEMVISGGENIYCAEVERAIAHHPAVIESATFGEPDDRLGERLVALVSCRAGHDANSDDIAKIAAAHVSAHKVPREIRLTTEALPRNASGKVMKAAVREQYEALSVTGNGPNKY